MKESELIEGLEDGDSEAVEELYRQYYDRVYAVVRKNVDNDWDAEEGAQDAMWKVVTKIDTFRRDSALWSWMYRIAVNEARMKTRSNKRQPTPVESQTLATMIEDRDDRSGRKPDETAQFHDLLEQLDDYLDDSKATNEKVFVDLELEGASKRDVAEQLDLSESAVKARLHRMRVGLRERLRDNYLNAG
ncbi:MAG: RNA polymerase sigma factor [Bradymonadaceae bacterium]